MPASFPAARTLELEPDGVFLSNGPGDPAALGVLSDMVGELLGKVPIFGVCLGHQLLGAALGARTFKLHFGHHGGNHPVRRLDTGRVEITSHNHNYARRCRPPCPTVESLPLEVTHVNLNDGVVEGLRCERLAAFGVQYHPEAGPGPHDSRYLFDAVPCADGKHRLMPRRRDIETILVIGSGPIVIGQACEFDYSGSQACRVLRAEGYRVVLANSNPATIMTDPDLADRTYIEPLDAAVLTAIVERERPDAILPDGRRPDGPEPGDGACRTGRARRVRSGAHRGERRGDRRPPRIATGSSGRWARSGSKCRRRGSPRSLERGDGRRGAGGVPAHGASQLHPRGGGHRHCERPRRPCPASRRKGSPPAPCHEILIERSIAGWKEFELEVMRDCADNCVVVCSIENLDPMGVHTGDSITVAPAQTLSDVEFQAMRDDAFACIRRVGVETGGSNIQFAVDPVDGRALGDRDEPACLTFISVGIQGDRLSDSQDRGASGGRLHARRDLQRHHGCHSGELRADHRLRRDKGPALGIRETSRERRPSRNSHAVGGRGDGHRPHVPRVPAESASIAGAGPGRPERGPCRARLRVLDDDDLMAKACEPTPERVFHMEAALQRGTTPDVLAEVTGVDRWFVDQLQTDHRRPA